MTMFHVSNTLTGSLTRLTGHEKKTVKTTAFLLFLAFLPQFVSLSAGSVALKVSVLGSIFALLCLFVCGLVGYFSGSLGDVLVEKPRFTSALRWITGGILVALGLRLAIPEQR